MMSRTDGNDKFTAIKLSQSDFPICAEVRFCALLVTDISVKHILPYVLR